MKKITHHLYVSLHKAICVAQQVNDKQRRLKMHQRDMSKLVCPKKGCGKHLSVHTHNTYICPFHGTIYKWNQKEGKLERVRVQKAPPC